MAMTEAAQAAQKAASAVMYGGAGMTAGSGASIPVSIYFGLSLGEWQVLGIICGALIGFVGLIGNLAISVYFKRAHLQLALAKAKPDPEA